MALLAVGRNAILTTGKAGITHVGACTDLNGTAVAGARQAVSWSAAGTPAAGQAGNSASISIPIAAGESPVVISLYDALSGGNRLGDFGYGGSGQQVKGLGTVVSIASDSIQSNGHGLTTDDRVFFSAVNGESLPAGLSATTLYFVRSAALTTDVFTVATTSGGAAVDITGLGEVMFQKTVINTFASPGTLTIATNTLILDLTQA